MERQPKKLMSYYSKRRGVLTIRAAITLFALVLPATACTYSPDGTPNGVDWQKVGKGLVGFGQGYRGAAPRTSVAPGNAMIDCHETLTGVRCFHGTEIIECRETLTGLICQ